MAETGNAQLPGAPFGIEARENSGEWQPFFDWFDVYPGNRWKDRHGQFGLFDSPSGIRLTVEEADVSEVLFRDDADWEGHLLPLYVWQGDGQYNMLYRAKGGTSYRYSKDGYQWTRPEIGRIEFNGSTANNLVCDQCVGPVVEDPQAPPEERFKSWVEVAGMFDSDTGEELSVEEGLKRMGEMEYAGDSYQGPPMVMRAFVRGFISPDLMHWTQIEKPVADMPSDGPPAIQLSSRKRKPISLTSVCTAWHMKRSRGWRTAPLNKITRDGVSVSPAPEIFATGRHPSWCFTRMLTTDRRSLSTVATISRTPGAKTCTACSSTSSTRSAVTWTTRSPSVATVSSGTGRNGVLASAWDHRAAESTAPSMRKVDRWSCRTAVGRYLSSEVPASTTAFIRVRRCPGMANRYIGRGGNPIVCAA